MMRSGWVLLLALGSPLGLAGVGFGLTCACALFGALAPETWRQRWSLGPMGLRKRPRKAPKPHGLLTLSEGVQCWKDWARTLPRSPRTTLLKQVQKAHSRTPYTITTRRGRPCLSLSLLRVVYQHQRRYYSPLRAALACWGRCLSMLMTTGVMDEVRRASDGALMAVCQTAVKGQTLRAQWFYQDAQASTLLVWFAMLIVNVQRGIHMHCRHIDAGPSTSANVADLKSRFGFTSTTDWIAGYDGPFRTPLPCSQLDLDDMNPCPTRQTTARSSKCNSSRRGRHKERKRPMDTAVAAATGRHEGRAGLQSATRPSPLPQRQNQQPRGEEGCRARGAAVPELQTTLRYRTLHTPSAQS